MLAALQLVNYVVDELNYEINQAYKFDQELAENLRNTPPNDDLGLLYNLLVNEEEDKYGITLTVNLNMDCKPVTDHYYRLKLTLFGEFIRPAGAPEPPEEVDLERYQVVTALSILYGVARVKIADLTSGTPFKKVNLPTVVFERIVDQIASQSSSEEDTGAGE